MFSRLLSGLLVSAMLLGSALTAQAQQTLNFGIMSTEASQNLKVLWDPFLKDMSKALGMEVKAFFASDYAGVIEGMRFKKVDLSWIGNKGAMVMVDRANGEVFAQTTAPDGSKGYYSCLIVNKKSPLQNLDDMFAQASKLSFSNGDPNSTSGFLVPGYYVFAKNRQGSPEDLRPYRVRQPRGQCALRGQQYRGRGDLQQRRTGPSGHHRSRKSQGTARDLEVPPYPQRSPGLAQGPA